MSWEDYSRYYDNWDDDTPEWHTTKRGRKKRAKPGVHVPNKNEAKLLRKLMAKTGLTEKELREHKTYRVQLSNAQQRKGSKTREMRGLLYILKMATRELKLPKEHPDVIAKFKELYEKRGFPTWRYQAAYSNLLEKLKK